MSVSLNLFLISILICGKNAIEHHWDVEVEFVKEILIFTCPVIWYSVGLKQDGDSGSSVITFTQVSVRSFKFS